MKNTSRLQGNDSVSASSYNIMKCVLTVSNGSKIEIRGLLTKIIITENLYSASIDADFEILDGSNLLESVKLNGDEKIDLVITRKGIDADNETHKHTFYISEIIDYARQRPGSATYTIRAVSQHAYINNIKTISGSFKGTIGTIINNICDQLDIKQKDINTSTNQEIKCIIPRLRPFAAIKWLNSGAFTSAGAPFYFFETLKGKVQYKSYEDFAKEKDNPVAEFEHSPFVKQLMGSADYFAESAKRIRKISSDLNLTKYISASEGGFASTTRNIDIATKKYDAKGKKYDYDINADSKLNPHNPFATRNNNDQYGGRKITETSTGKNYFISVNTESHDGSQSFHDPVNTGVAKGQSFRATEDSILHDITVNGNFKIQCGSIIKIVIGKTNAEETAETSSIDQFQSGNYLISSISHIFSDEYTQQLEIKSNSFKESLDTIIDIQDAAKAAKEEVI